MNGSASIRDVAATVGMSLGTVSGVLNGKVGFADETRKTIWNAANAMGYSPSPHARKLRAGNGGRARVKTGIVIHITHLGEEDAEQDRFEAMRSLMLIKEAARLGLYPITYRYRHLSGFQCPPVLNGHVDGAIVGTPHPEVVDALRGKIPTVLMDVPFTPGINDGIPMVNTDLRMGFDLLFERLHALGHRRIATFTARDPGEGVWGEEQVAEILASAAARHGLVLSEENRLSARITPKTHEKVMAQAAPFFANCVRERGVTALVFPNHYYVNSLLPLLRTMGFRVPSDVSLAALYVGVFSPESDCCAVTYVWKDLLSTSVNVLRGLIDGRDALACREYLVRPEFSSGTTLDVAPRT